MWRGVLRGTGVLLSFALVLAMPATTARADILGTASTAAATTSYFNWVDDTSPGMGGDAIHILDPGTQPASGTVGIPGGWSASFSVAAGANTYVSVPQGVIGGPAVVRVSSGPGVIASQRVTYDGSFFQVPAATQASTDAWLPWYDSASPGMSSDTIHVLDPGSQPATVTLTLPGSAPIQLSVGAGQDAYQSFPQGTIGGPLHIQSTQPVISCQRVVYQSSFSQIQAMDSGQAASTLYFDWYDQASPGMSSDAIHLLDPGSQASSVTLSGPGLAAKSVTIQPGAETYVSWSAIGGPVTARVTSGSPILATQRLIWNSQFSEWPGSSAAQASTDTWFNWYDDVTTGMVDDIHVTDPGSATAHVTLTLGSQSPVSLTVNPGQDTVYSYPSAIGGPLHVQSDQPVLAVQRAELVPPAPTSRTLSVPLYYQEHELGCEEASLRMALAYEGITVSEDQVFASMGTDTRAAQLNSAGRVTHWGDPQQHFVGNPDGSEVTLTGYGSYNEAVARTAGQLGGHTLMSGQSIPAQTVYQSVLQGHPVIAWISFDWASHPTYTYYAYNDNRPTLMGAPYEHAVVVIGVTPTSVIVNNPWYGRQTISRSTFQAAYGMFDRMAVVMQ